MNPFFHQKMGRKMFVKGARSVLAVLLFISGGVASTAATPESDPATVMALTSAPVTHQVHDDVTPIDGVVEAIRQTRVTAQVTGAIVDIRVKAGDTVRAGQELLKLDARAAQQTAAASAAQVLAAQAQQDEARKELARQRELFNQNYISRAALDRAEARHHSTQAEANALRAAAGASQIQSGFYIIKAPYDGVVSEVPVALGDMAMPGKPLLTLYDPTALRVSAKVPEAMFSKHAQASARLALGQSGEVAIAPTSMQWIPQADPTTHTVELRLELPSGLPQAIPGAFARVYLASSTESERLYIPASAVVRRAEVTGVYLLNDEGRPVLRQIRTGPLREGFVEVLSGLSLGQHVALDPALASRKR